MIPGRLPRSKALLTFVLFISAITVVAVVHFNTEKYYGVYRCELKPPFVPETVKDKNGKDILIFRISVKNGSFAYYECGTITALLFNSCSDSLTKEDIGNYYCVNTDKGIRLAINRDLYITIAADILVIVVFLVASMVVITRKEEDPEKIL